MKHQPRKRFGQNFLVDDNVIYRMAQSIHPNQDDNMVEIGPGLGALTKELLPLLKKLTVIELDRDLIPLLQKKFHHLGKLDIHQGDALKFDYGQLADEQRKLRIVGNLPYNISTPLIFHLLRFLPIIQDMYFLLQKELVKRLAASPGSSDYGRLTVMVQYHCQVHQLFDVPPNAFDPAPKVMSAYVHLLPRPTPRQKVKDMAAFEAIVRNAFNQRRKTIHNSLKKIISTETLTSLGIDPNLRPEQLSVDDFVTIANNH